MRDQLMATVNGAKDNPQALASWHAANLFYGDDDPRGRPMSKTLDRGDRRAPTWWRSATSGSRPTTRSSPSPATSTRRRSRRSSHKTFGGWKKHDVPPVTDPPARPLPAAGKSMPVRLVDKPDATQSTMLVLGPGIRHADPQYYAVRLMNYALGGGGFSSRLMKVVRSEGGKTYGVRSSFARRARRGAVRGLDVHAQRRDHGDAEAGARRDRQDAQRRPDGGGAQGGQEQHHRRLRAAPRDRDRSGARSSSAPSSTGSTTSTSSSIRRGSTR